MAGTVNRSLPGKVDGRLAAPLAWLFALRCLVCGEPGANGRDLCTDCLAALPRQGPACPRCALPMPHPGTCGECLQRPPPLDAAHAAFDYAFPLDRLLPRLKFHRDFAAGRVLAQCMAERYVSLPRPDALLPVPLHPQRLRERGFNQSVELACPLARAWNLPLLLDAVVRVRHQQAAQAGLRRAQRLRNLRGAFVARQRLDGAHVLVVDDVMTTGTTLDVLARCLKAAGAARVSNLVVARTPAVH